MPVASEVTANGRMEPGVWPAMKVVRTIYHGGYEGLPPAWREFMAWIESNDLKISPRRFGRDILSIQTLSPIRQNGKPS